MKRTNGRLHAEEDLKTPRHMKASYPQRSSLMPFALGAVVGSIIGASIAILYAPVEGSEFRRGMGEALDDLVDGAKGLVKDVKTSAEKLFNEGLGSEEDADSPLDRTRERVDDILEDADRAIAEARRRSTSASPAGRPKEDEEEG